MESSGTRIKEKGDTGIYTVVCEPVTPDFYKCVINKVGYK